MIKFLVRSAAFLLLLTSITFILTVVLEKKLGALTNTYSLKRHQLESQADSIEILVLGTSHSLHGVNPAYFSFKGYNASNSAQSLFYDVHITLKYLDRMPRLKYVLIAVSDYSMGFEMIDTQEKWRDYFYAQCWGIKFPEIKSTDLYLYSKILLYSPEISLGYALQCFHVNLTENYYSNGWARLTEGSEINDCNGYNRVKLHNSFYNPKRYESIKGSLDTFLSMLKERNIIPVFFTPPVTSCYFKYADKEKLEIMTKTISGLCDKYGCSYFNYFTDNRFIVGDFADCDHLNSLGAEKFSKILNQDILVNGKR